MKITGWILITTSLILCLGTENRVLLFSPARAFLFCFEITLFWVWCGFWNKPQEAPLFYWGTLPLRLISATSALVPFSLLWKTELFLLFGAYLPQSVYSIKKGGIPFCIVFVWLTFLGPLLLSYCFAEFFEMKNQWFLWSPVLWVPAELGMLPA